MGNNYPSVPQGRPWAGSQTGHRPVLTNGQEVPRVSAEPQGKEKAELEEETLSKEKSICMMPITISMVRCTRGGCPEGTSHVGEARATSRRPVRWVLSARPWCVPSCEARTRRGRTDRRFWRAVTVVLSGGWNGRSFLFPFVYSLYFPNFL